MDSLMIFLQLSSLYGDYLKHRFTDGAELLTLQTAVKYVNIGVMKRYSKGITDLLIATLFSARSPRTLKAILRERELQDFKENNLRSTLSRLHKKGYLYNEERKWFLTTKGKKFFENKELLSYLPSPFPQNSTATVIISFDIPESDRKIRNWLRNQIKIYAYHMLQQSLWLGPGPLPNEFLKRLDKLGIRKHIKTFKIAPAKI